MYYTYADTPAGKLLLTGDGNSISGLHWTVFRRAPKPALDWQETPKPFMQAIAELNDYFLGNLTEFTITYTASGTPFQQAVWKELEKIPYGKTTTYKAIAQAIDKPNAVRAVGTAVGSNPMSIVIPCHRVIASNGTLGGYAGGLTSKQILFNIEAISIS